MLSKQYFRSVFILPFERFNFSIIHMSSSSPPPFTCASSCHSSSTGKKSNMTRKEDCRCRVADDGATLGAECAKENLLRR